MSILYWTLAIFTPIISQYVYLPLYLARIFEQNHCFRVFQLISCNSFCVDESPNYFQFWFELTNCDWLTHEKINGVTSPPFTWLNHLMAQCSKTPRLKPPDIISGVFKFSGKADVIFRYHDESEEQTKNVSMIRTHSIYCFFCIMIVTAIRQCEYNIETLVRILRCFVFFVVDWSNDCR